MFDSSLRVGARTSSEVLGDHGRTPGGARTRLAPSDGGWVRESEAETHQYWPWAGCSASFFDDLAGLPGPLCRHRTRDNVGGERRWLTAFIETVRVAWPVPSSQRAIPTGSARSLHTHTSMLTYFTMANTNKQHGARDLCGRQQLLCSPAAGRRAVTKRAMRTSLDL